MKYVLLSLLQLSCFWLFAGPPMPKHLIAYKMTHNAPGNMYLEGQTTTCDVPIDFVDTSLIIVGCDSFHIIRQYFPGEMSVAYTCMFQGKSSSVSIEVLEQTTKYRIVTQYQDSMIVYEANVKSKSGTVDQQGRWKLHLFKVGDIVHMEAKEPEYFSFGDWPMSSPAYDWIKWHRFDSTLVIDTTNTQWIHFRFDDHGIHVHPGRRVICYLHGEPASPSTQYELIIIQKMNHRKKFYTIDMKNPNGLVRHFLAKE